MGEPIGAAVSAGDGGLSVHKVKEEEDDSV